MLLSAERSPLSDGSGSTERRLEDQHKSPKLRQICGPWAGSLVGPEPAFKLVILGSFLGFPHFAWNLYFYSVFVQIPIHDVKMLGTILVKISDPQKPIWTVVSPFCGPWTGAQNGTSKSSKRNKTRNTKKMWTTQNQTLLSAERSLFGQK